MPTATVRNAVINYEVIGTRGPWVALSPGGRLDLRHVSIDGPARGLANAGYRVLLHDRRNCGASDVVLDGQEPEFQIWADDLHALLGQLDALPAVVGGLSAGCRMSLVYALRYPSAVGALLLWRVTGGAFAAQRLAHNYYTQYIDAVQLGGMAALCETEHFGGRIQARPSNRERIMAVNTERFIDVMSTWRESLLADADRPVIGATAEQLQSILVPTCVIPGNDRVHNHTAGEAVHRLIPNSELHDLFPGDPDADMARLGVDVSVAEEWRAKTPELVAIFVDFLRRCGLASQVATSISSACICGLPPRSVAWLRP
jgi:pimeloyl-ACP methyl ester carboxylesterase